MYTHIVVDENWLMIGCCFSLSSATGTADVISQTHAELHGKHADVVDFRRVRLQALNFQPPKTERLDKLEVSKFHVVLGLLNSDPADDAC